MSTRRKGFTVIELLLVLLFIGILAAMAVGISSRSRNRWALRNTAREITSIFYQAKQLASRESEAVMIDFTADEYMLNLWRNGDWEPYKTGKYGAKVTVSKTPSSPTGFAISPSGFIINPDTNVIWGMQTVLLKTPHVKKDTFDSMTIEFYPYGGVRVQKDFK
jgi:prepilin-type N-terminal cleavage/methylation domain-containing protein